MFKIKRLVLLAITAAALSVSARADELVGTVNDSPSPDFTDADLAAVAKELAGPADEPLPLPDERQAKTQYSEEARKTMKKALEAFVQFAEIVGRASERGFNQARESVSKGLASAREHTHKGYITARKATAKGLQSLGKRLEVRSDTSTTTPYPEATEHFASPSGEAFLERTPSDREGKDTEESVTGSTDPSFTSSVPEEGFARVDLRRGDRSRHADRERQ
ncbi:dense granule protein GRA2 [Besnoitia besnoiti]|uniref:Dense granule protein GRA2 n=1 Tax=Besnoitia besnoiti TaxID=94643 RepID=A0A2A9MCU1_BESBE|nr:dense granule protein GRA2 [Besnoitia besnoiti]PFH35034.1 dense granule protein GRA2 [Besnoitia besnoiti]